MSQARYSQRHTLTTLSIVSVAIGILFLGGALRIYHIGHQDLWYDETYSVFLIDHFDQLQHDFHPPLYYSLLKRWSQLIGYGEAQLRALSAVGSLLAVLITGVLAGLIGGSFIGLLSAVLVACSPIQIWYAQEVRSYAWLTAFVGLLLFSLARRAEHPLAWRWRTLFIGACLAAIYTSYAAGFFLAAMPILLVAKSYRTQWKGILFDLVLVGLGCLPLLPLAGTQGRHFTQGFWIPQADSRRVLQCVQDLTLGYETTASWGIPVLLGVFIFGLVRWWRKDRAIAALLAMGSLGPVVTCLALSLWRPLFLPRQLVPVVLTFWIAIASGLLWSRRGVVRLSLSAVVFLCLAIGLRHQFFDVLPRGKPPFTPIFDFIEEQWASGDALIHTSTVTVFPAFYYGATLRPYIRLWWEGHEHDTSIIASQWIPTTRQWEQRRIYALTELKWTDHGRLWVLYGSEDRDGKIDAHPRAIRSWLRKQQVPELEVCVGDVLIERYAATQSASGDSREDMSASGQL